MKVNVIGQGYIGLPTALVLAGKNAAEVVGSDRDTKLVETLQQGEVPFKEEGMDALLEQARANGIRFQTKYDQADIYIIAVPTPYDKNNKKIDACYVMAATQSVLEVCPDGAVIVIESTVSPGTIDNNVRPMVEKWMDATGKTAHIAHAPERILPGKMLYELENNSRTIGADDPAVARRLQALYASFCKGEIILTDIRTAEMTKVVENTYRDINIAFANELTKICRSAKLDVYEVIRIANKHPRVNILRPGPGVGGHCISVDPWFLVGDYPGLANIILAAREINDSMPGHVIERIHHIMKKHGIEDLARVGLYGLTYKADVDDTRESPTLQLLELLEKNLAKGIKVYDPFITEQQVANQYFDFDAFLQDIDLVVLMVPHQQILDRMPALEGKLVLDTQNICTLKGTYRL